MAPTRRCRGLGRAVGLGAAGFLGAAAALLNTCNFVQVPRVQVARPQRSALRLSRREAGLVQREAVDGLVTKEDVQEEEDEEDRKILVSELEVGQEVDGVVVRGFGFLGYFVDIGAESNGLLEFEELVDGFPSKDEELRKGEFVTARVLETDGINFYLTRRTGDLARPPRFREKHTQEDVEAFQGVHDDEWLQGEVAGMWAKGVWVKITPPSGGWPVRSLVKPEDFTDGFAKTVFPGMKVMVRVTGVDVPQKRIDITMRDP
eukprot:TRINITY_DN49722_c0_g1_i1.p1 TRINITY_DN49722_c0_g1~~TRINITY_DN49722_c0_g1_i1.p1  ORF type:complete len:261 (-),score=55.08 TRINITY_DN49722_c0_g1_i1:276-1058(-)